MNAEEIREYCIKKQFVTEDFPFDDTTLVMKVKGKMFMLMSLAMADELWLNLKCEPEKAIEYREQYEYVRPGYHMNKKHWNTIDISESVDRELILNMIDDSYNLVVQKLPLKERKEFQ